MGVLSFLHDTLLSIDIVLLLLARCPMLTAPENGMINCVLGGDGVADPADTCTVTCDDNFMITSGVAMRTCGDDGMWSGSDTMCGAGKVSSFNVYVLYVCMC